ncbi:restriction endonuclease [Leucobacter salsicius]|uniref:restriction endonuclease n=1 Tax=Leucobacter salsicius TaxID=664638 RepID=UPI0003494973|nr:restriction endonuclease [Leucobacter salsicius]
MSDFLIDDLTTDEDASFDVDKNTPAWRQFEKDVVLTLRSLDPAAEVVHDQKIPGSSGEERQLDAVARKAIAGAHVDVVIECKLYNRKLGIGKIDEFVGKLLDVGAGLGILYAAKGVTEPARKRAETALNPRIVLRDISNVVEGLESQAVDLSELIEDEVLGTCQVDACLFGDVQLFEVDEIEVGHCGSCGTLHLQCGCCGELSDVEWDRAVCYVCNAEYSILSYQGDLDGIELVTHGPDCEHISSATRTESFTLILPRDTPKA